MFPYTLEEEKHYKSIAYLKVIFKKIARIRSKHNSAVKIQTEHFTYTY